VEARRPAVVPHEELGSALASRRELGAEFESELVESLVERIEQRLERRIDERLAERTRRSPDHVVAVTSLLVSVPLIAVAAWRGLAAVVAVCVALVLVNVAVRRG
jgi:hypothetical protein